MRIKETVLGGGLSRLDVEPMFCGEESLPTSVVDEIMRDIIKRKKNGETCDCHRHESDWNLSMTNVPTFGRPSVSNRCHCEAPNREPDGIDVHVDRPLRGNFRTFGEWNRAFEKYRNLEKAAKQCDWECREPMKGMEQHPCFDDEPCFKCEEDDFFEIDSEMESELFQILGRINRLF